MTAGGPWRVACVVVSHRHKAGGSGGSRSVDQIRVRNKALPLSFFSRAMAGDAFQQIELQRFADS